MQEEEQRKDQVKLEDMEEGTEPLHPQMLLSDIVDLKKQMKDVYDAMPEEDRNKKEVWRPLQKEITLLYLAFEQTFFLEEKVKKEVEQLEAQKKNAKQRILQSTEQAIKMQEKLK